MIEDFKIIDVGPSTAETVELQYQVYKEIAEYRNGRTWRELWEKTPPKKPIYRYPRFHHF